MEGFDSVKAASHISAMRTKSSFAGRGREGIDAGNPGAAAADGYPGLFDEYRKTLRVYNAVDFDDLIAMPLEIFTAFPESANALGKRFR
jgi:superfamily I DNA/RNA helicase